MKNIDQEIAAARIMNRDGWEVPWATTTVALEGLL
jgi:hypothetical protein